MILILLFDNLTIILFIVDKKNIFISYGFDSVINKIQ